MTRMMPLLLAALLARPLVAGEPTTMKSIYDIPLADIKGAAASLAPYKGRVLLIVNVASKCGHTPQYAGLEALYQKYKDRGLTVLGFPSNDYGGQEPGTNAEIVQFCTKNYGVQFPLFDKLHTKGPDQHPLYAWLTGKAARFPGDVAWNFEKFLVDPHGAVVARFKSGVKPDAPELVAAIEQQLAR